jgi:hypothetical protein
MFINLPANNPALAGQPAARKRLFGEFSRYAVWPAHSRFDRLHWFVSDAEVIDDLGSPAIIRQGDSLREVLEGFDLSARGE